MAAAEAAEKARREAEWAEISAIKRRGEERRLAELAALQERWPDLLPSLEARRGQVIEAARLVAPSVQADAALYLPELYVRVDFRPGLTAEQVRAVADSGHLALLDMIVTAQTDDEVRAAYEAVRPLAVAKLVHRKRSPEEGELRWFED